jgi:hypothetical protein
VSRNVARLRANIFRLTMSLVLVGFGLYLFLTRSADEDGVRGSFGLGLVGAGVFLFVVLVLLRHLVRSQKP